MHDKPFTEYGKQLNEKKEVLNEFGGDILLNIHAVDGRMVIEGSNQYLATIQQFIFSRFQGVKVDAQEYAPI